MRIPLRLDQKDIIVRASLGISVVDEDAALDADELLRNADVAMYMAKRDSKGAYRLFEPAMHERVVERLELRADLQRALVNNAVRALLPAGVRLKDGSDVRRRGARSAGTIPSGA